MNKIGIGVYTQIMYEQKISLWKTTKFPVPKQQHWYKCRQQNGIKTDWYKQTIETKIKKSHLKVLKEH